MTRPTRRRVVVTGAGTLSPLGSDPEALSAALLSGETAFRPLGELQFDRDADLDRLSRPTAAGVIFDPRDHLDGNYRPIDRTGQLVVIAAQRALEQAGWTAERRAEYEVGLVLGTMFGSVHTISAFDRRGMEAGPKYVKPFDFANSVINAAAGQTAIWLDLRGVNSTVTGGAAASLQAIAQGCELVRGGRSDALLAGGAEELSFEAFYAFQQASMVSTGELPTPFDARRDGFVPGEGSALLLLEDADSASSRGATPLAEITGHGSAYDISRGHDPESLAAALERAIRQALDDADVSGGADGGRAVDVVSAGANGLVRADAAEARALAATADGAAVTAVKSSLGESFGAGGGFQALTLLETLRSGRLPGVSGWEQADPDFPALDLRSGARNVSARRGLLTAVSYDGLACAVVIERLRG